MLCSCIVFHSAFLCILCVYITAFDMVVLGEAKLICIYFIFLFSIPCIYCSFSKVNFQDKTTLLLLSFAFWLYHYTLHRRVCCNCSKDRLKDKALA